MLTVAPPDALELRANATFEALMWSMSRPGLTFDMPEPGLSALIETLVDLECTVFADQSALREQLTATGARLVDDPSQADHVFLSVLEGQESVLSALRVGDPIYPDKGATLIAVVRREGGHRVRLSGPGVDRAVEATFCIQPQFWDLRAKLCAYPAGFDMLLVDGRSVTGIPRSTQVEVL